MNHRGDVVIVTVPYANGGSKARPAVVIQCDRLNRKLDTTLIAAITSNLKHVKSEPTQLLIDPATGEAQGSGILQPSAVKCENLFTVSQKRIQRTVGHLSTALLQRLETCLKQALELP